MGVAGDPASIHAYICSICKVALHKVGTSFVATIPAELVQQLKLVEGQKLAVV